MGGLQSEVSVENLQRTNRSLEQRLALTQSELTATKASLTATQGDYDNYKVSHTHTHAHTYHTYTHSCARKLILTFEKLAGMCLIDEYRICLHTLYMEVT